MSNLVTSRNQILPIAARSIAAAAALCCAGLASAQTAPSVTLYGMVDVGITSVSGLKGGTATQLASGIMEGSRWGLKGNEDLGGGYRTIFTLENRFEADTGALGSRPISGLQLSDRYSQATLLGLPATLQPVITHLAGQLATASWGVNIGNNLFDRQAYVGLVTPFGGFLAGRQYTPAFETNATYDIMETQSALSAGQVAAFPAVLEIRKSNALQYRFVKDGMSGSFMYALGEVAGDAAKGRMLGLNANYKTGAFSVGFGYNTANNENGDKSLTTSVLGASMNFGSDKLSGMLIKITDDNPSNMTGIGQALSANPATAAYAALIQGAYTTAFKQDGTLVHIGYRHVTGPHTMSVAYSSFNDKTASNADVASYGVAYTYALSKRTDLNGVLVRIDNKDRGQVAPGGNGYVGGVTASAGTSSTGIAFGLRHRF